MTEIITREKIEQLMEIWESSKRKALAHGNDTSLQEDYIALCNVAIKALDTPAPPSDDVVEKVARAMWEARFLHALEYDPDRWESITYQDTWRKNARVAIAALREIK